MPASVPPGLLAELLTRQSSFRKWLKDFGLSHLLPGKPAHPNLGYQQTVHLPGYKFPVQIIGLDSSWLCGDDSDAGKLRLTEDQVMRLCTDPKGVSLSGFRIGLVHHPLTDLADGSASRRLLAENIDLLLRGHLHEPEPELWTDSEKSLHQIAAGCLYEGHHADRYPNSCIVIRSTCNEAGQPLFHELRFRGYSSRGGFWFDDGSLYRSAPNGRLKIAAMAHASANPRQIALPSPELLLTPGENKGKAKDRSSRIARPTRASIRAIIEKLLITDSDLDGFCVDYFPFVYKRFTNGMDRISKVNLLIELVSSTDLLTCFRQSHTEELEANDALLVDTPTSSWSDDAASQLEILYQDRDVLTSYGQDTRKIDTIILELKRKQRQGVQLHEGEIVDNRYKLLEIVGRGGFANVWQAYDRLSRQLVAVKVLHGQWSQDSSRIERFQRGAREMAALTHPHIVRVIDGPNEDAGFHYFVMEYLPGGDLAKAIKNRKITTTEALKIIAAISDAAHFAHEHGCIHRDIKPQNIMIDADGVEKLTDFDLVHVENSTGGTRTGAMGTFIYAAPEELDNAKDVDRRTDVYSLGMTTLFVLFGDDLPTLAFQSGSTFVDEIKCSAPLRNVIKRAIAWKRELRFNSASDYGKVLRQFVDVEKWKTHSRNLVISSKWRKIGSIALSAAGIVLLSVFANIFAARFEGRLQSIIDRPEPSTSDLADLGAHEPGSGMTECLIETDLMGADIFLDGSIVGIVSHPSTKLVLAYGKHELRLADAITGDDLSKTLHVESTKGEPCRIVVSGLLLR